MIIMKIAFAYDLPFPWHMGGIEKINREESIVLANSNEVHFFTLKWPKMEKDFTDSKVHYHAYFSSSIDTAYRHGRRSMRKALLFSISLFNLFRYRFDVLIIDQFPYVHIPVAWLFCRLTGCKMVMKVAEIWDRDYWERYTNPLTGSVAYAFSRFWVKRADFYIANSMDTKEKLESFTGRYGVTIAFSPILDRPKIEKAIEDSKYNDNPGVIFVGRLIKEKRLDRWIDMVSKAHQLDSSVHGTIIGEGIGGERLRKAIKDKGYESFIKMAGKVESNENLYSMIAASRLMLNMSEREGLSVTSIESLALGTPVLLPSYTPIPKEVKGMCIVMDEADMPKTIAEMFNAKDKSKYIRNISGLDLYYTMNIPAYYNMVFEKLGLGNGKKQ